MSDLRLIAQHYLRTWFVMDIVGSFPIDKVSHRGSEFRVYRLEYMCRTPRLKPRRVPYDSRR